jgi:small subunit ribosomal protein S4
MGDPRRLRKKYRSPENPFDKLRIVDEMKYLGEYGLRNKKEFWKHKAQVSHFRSLARSYRKLSKEQYEKHINELRGKLAKLGLVGTNATPDDILSLTTEKLLKRRLQTIVYEKGFAKTITQARQLVTHSHIAIAGEIVDSPSYLCTVDDEKSISFAINSPLLNNREKLFPPVQAKPEKAPADHRGDRKGKRTKKKEDDSEADAEAEPANEGEAEE